LPTQKLFSSPGFLLKIGLSFSTSS